MQIALVQFNPTVGDFSGNSRRILDLAAQAKSRGAQLTIFSMPSRPRQPIIASDRINIE